MAFLTHLNDNCGSLHIIDAINIQGEMMDFYEKAKGVPHYINMMEEAQYQAQQVNLPISDAVLVAAANRDMVVTNDYPDEKIWNKMAPSKRTWAKWKPAYKETYNATQRLAVNQAKKGTPFGGMTANPGSGKLKNRRFQRRWRPKR